MAVNTTPKIDPAVMSRIQKLLSRTAETGCTQEEAATALSMAQRLMTEANITMEEIRSSDAQGGDSDWSDEVIGSIKRTQWNAQQGYGGQIIEDFFFVKTIRCHSHDSNGVQTWDYHIFGRPANVETAKFVFTALMRSFYTLWQDYRAEHGASASDREIFVVGVAKGFRDKLTEERRADEMRQDIMQSGSGKNEIILASLVEKTKLAFHEAYPSTRKGHSLRPKGSQSSLDAGYNRGRKLNLNRQVGGQGQGKLR